MTKRANHCTCPDFATSQLGACKHIEAVLYQIGKRKDFAAIRHQPLPLPYVYLDWDGDNAPRIRLHRGNEITAHLSLLLAHYRYWRCLHRPPARRLSALCGTGGR